MNLANRITLVRIILIPFFIAAIAYGRFHVALIFFVIAIVTDGLDGFIARARKEKTELGTILDPVADKLLLISAFVCLSLVRAIPESFRLPPYVPIVVISRDVFIVIGSIVVYMVNGDVKVRPSVVGKATTFFQMMTIVAVLIKFPQASLVWNAAVALTVVSGIDYLLKGSRLLNGSHSTPARKGAA